MALDTAKLDEALNMAIKRTTYAVDVREIEQALRYSEVASRLWAIKAAYQTLKREGGYEDF